METPRRRETLVHAVSLAVAALAVHHQLLWNGFVNLDDPSYVTRNAHVQGGLTASGVAWAFTTFHSYNWHPLTWLSHMLDVQVWGMEAPGHHLTSLVLHAANAALLYLVLRRATGSPWRSGAVAALFAAHPLHVESVAWVAERKDVLSATFFMLTLWCWIGADRRPARVAAAVASFAAGLLAKPMLVTVPLVLLLLDGWPLARAPLANGGGGRAALRAWGRLLVEKLPFVALAAASCIVTLAAQNSGGKGAIVYESSPALNAGNAVLSYVRYLGKAAWPVDLAVIYPFRAADVTPAGVAAAATLLAALTAVAFALRRTRPYLLFGWLWFLATLLPVIGFVRIGWHAIADRYTYLPMIGIYVATVWAIGDLVERLRVPRAAVAAVTAVVLAVLAVLTVRQELLWRSSVALFEHAVRVTEDNALAHINLGAAYGVVRDPRAKREALLGHLLEARDVAALHPGDPDAEYRLGNAYADMEDFPEAIAAFRRSLALRPGFPRAHNNLGIAYARLGNLEDATRAFTEALRIDPGFRDARDNLALMERLRGERVRR